MEQNKKVFVLNEYDIRKAIIHYIDSNLHLIPAKTDKYLIDFSISENNNSVEAVVAENNR